MLIISLWLTKRALTKKIAQTQSIWFQNTVTYIYNRSGCRSDDVYQPWYNNVPLAKNLLGWILILVGLIFLTTGERFFDFFAAIIIGVAAGFFLWVVSGSYIKIGFIEITVVCVIVSFLLISCIHKVLVYVIGIILGNYFGNIVYSIELRFIPGDPNTIYMATIIVCGILGYLLAAFINQVIIVIATSILGAYFFVRVSLLFNIYREF